MQLVPVHFFYASPLHIVQIILILSIHHQKVLAKRPIPVSPLAHLLISICRCGLGIKR
jgi:hypothetical protein